MRAQSSLEKEMGILHCASDATFMISQQSTRVPNAHPYDTQRHSYNKIVHPSHPSSGPTAPLRHPRPPHSPHLTPLPSIQLRPHIQIETGSSGRTTRSPRVEVNHVVDARATPVDDPVVTVEWGCVAENGVDSCGWGHSFHFVGEGFEFGAVASGTC